MSKGNVYSTQSIDCTDTLLRQQSNSMIYFVHIYVFIHVWIVNMLQEIKKNQVCKKDFFRNINLFEPLFICLLHILYCRGFIKSLNRTRKKIAHVFLVLPLAGNSEIGAHVRSNLCELICERHLSGSRGVRNKISFSLRKELLFCMRAQHVLNYPLI